MKGKIVLRVAAFAIILLAALSGVSHLLNAPGTSRVNYQWIHSFYDESENTLDGVFIGSSHVFTGILPPLAWKRYGITVWPFTSSRQQLAVAKDLIEEARKTQPDAVYIVELRNPVPKEIAEYLEASTHDLADSLPMSRQKFRIINKLCNLGGYRFSDRLEYFFPIFRYHSQWTELEETNFKLENNGVKGACTRITFMNNITNVQKNLPETDKREEVAETTYDILEELFRYCESEQVKLVFLIPPRATGDLDEYTQHNTLKQFCEERGFPVIDERAVMDEIGLDLQYDFYDEEHTNIHGAIKRTEYLSQYLIEHYGFQDKHGVPGYESWDVSWQSYSKLTDSRVLDFEWGLAPRDIALAAPKLSELKIMGTSMMVSWQETVGADGYRIYRKQVTGDEDPPGWKFIDETAADTLEYVDSGLDANATYCYTVVAFRKENDNYYFGRVSYKGVTGTALLNAPESLELSPSLSYLILSWEDIEEADGYEISRGILADIADRIETDVGKETSFLDTFMLADVPYGYQVRAYRYDEKLGKVYGSWSEEKVWIPERSGPDAKVELIDGIPTLSWEKMEGITGYWIDRKEENGEWEPMAADPLSSDNTTFQDVTVKEGKQYIYRIRAYLEYGGESYYYSGQTAKIIAKKDGIELSAPEILLCNQEGNKIFLVWKPVETATHYRVYRYRWDEETETWGEKYTEKLTDPACQQSPEKSGRYFYVVRALYDNGAYMNLGDYDKSKGCVVDYRKINNAD